MSEAENKKKRGRQPKVELTHEQQMAKFDEQIIAANDKIASLEERLANAKKDRDDLITKKQVAELAEVNELIASSGMSIEEIKAMLSKKK